jgi:hypothetical protein
MAICLTVSSIQREQPELHELMQEWKLKLDELGPSPYERLKKILQMDCVEMIPYADPLAQRECQNDEYISKENVEMDRILQQNHQSLLKDGTVNAGCIAKFALLYHHYKDEEIGSKIKLTLDRLIEVGQSGVKSNYILMRTYI